MQRQQVGELVDGTQLGVVVVDQFGGGSLVGGLGPGMAAGGGATVGACGGGVAAAVCCCFGAVAGGVT